MSLCCGYCSDRCLQDNPTLQPVNQSISPQLESEGPKGEESISAGHDRACFRDFDPPPPAPVKKWALRYERKYFDQQDMALARCPLLASKI